MKNLLTILLGFTLLILSSSCISTARPSYIESRTVIVKKVPKNHKVVYVKGHKYYVWGGKQYKQTRKGFLVVKF